MSKFLIRPNLSLWASMSIFVFDNTEYDRENNWRKRILWNLWMNQQSQMVAQWGNICSQMSYNLLKCNSQSSSTCLKAVVFSQGPRDVMYWRTQDMLILAWTSYFRPEKVASGLSWFREKKMARLVYFTFCQSVYFLGIYVIQQML